MRAIVRWSIALLVLRAAVGTAQPAVATAELATGKLWFDGRATVGNFTGTTTTVTGHLSGGASLAEVRGWVEAPVATLRTGNDRRDKDLRKSMETDRFPTIRFELARVMVGSRTGDTTSVSLEGTFTIHGVSRKVTLPATVVLGERPHVRARTPLNLKDYSIGGLSKMLGILKMYEDIVVGVDLVFAPVSE